MNQPFVERAESGDQRLAKQIAKSLCQALSKFSNLTFDSEKYKGAHRNGYGNGLHFNEYAFCAIHMEKGAAHQKRPHFWLTHPVDASQILIGSKSNKVILPEMPNLNPATAPLISACNAHFCQYLRNSFERSLQKDDIEVSTTSIGYGNLGKLAGFLTEVHADLNKRLMQQGKPELATGGELSYQAGLGS